MSETKITVIYDNPTDPAAFEAAYESEQLEAARRIPGHLRLETSKVWPKEDGSPTPAYRMIDLYYPDYAAVSAAVTTPEAGAFFAAMTPLSTGGVRVLYWSPTSRCRSSSLLPTAVAAQMCLTPSLYGYPLEALVVR